MSRKKDKRKKLISRKEFIFNFISLIILIIICLYFGGRSIYYYSRQNNTMVSSNLADKIVSNNKIVNSGDGFYQEKNGYIFKGKVSNNYVKFSNRLFRIMEVSNDNVVKIVSDTNQSTLIWGDDSSYENSNLNNWLNKTDMVNSGIYFDTISNSSLLSKTSYKDNILLKSGIKETKDKYSNYVTSLTINDYIDAKGKDSYLNNGKYFWLIGHNSDNSNLFVDSTGSVEEATSYESYGVRTVISMKKDVSITGGVGSIDDPYVIDMKGNNNYVDQYVKLGNDVWKVYGDKDNKLKLVLNGYIMQNGTEYMQIYSKTTSLFELNNRYNIGYYLNKVYYNSLSYKDLLLDNDYYVGEISNETGLSIQNIYTDVVTAKVGLLNIFDYNTNLDLTDYYYLNKTSSVGSMIYVGNKDGLLDEDVVSEVKHIVPTICIDKSILKNGDGSLNNPYVME